MFTWGFAETLVDIMTTNPSLSGIPSASAILDTSNYTIQTITIGKDAEGYKYHSHTVSSLSGSTYNSGYLLIKVLNTQSPSSYHSSSTHNYYSSVYNSVPQAPKITDRRLEDKSTITNVSAYDLGHYINAIKDPSLSSAWNVIGAFPPSGAASNYLMVDSSGGFVMSGVLSGMLNSLNVVDRYGFITINPATPQVVPVGPLDNGPYFNVITSSLSATPVLYITLGLQLGDGAAIAAFGGLNHFGLWRINLKELIQSGLNPPYDIKNINISSKYKLIAKATMWKDLMVQNDYIVIPGVLEFPGFKTGLASSSLTYLGPVYVLRINFT